MRDFARNPSKLGVVSLLVSLSPCLLVWTSAEEIVYDFRGVPYDAKDFRPTGSNVHQVMQTDAQGLRIVIPADHVNKLPVGLVSRHGIRGDFEITLAFEILHVDKPTAGGGAGIGIYITMASPTKEAATIAQLVKQSGEQALLVHRASTSADGKRQHRSESYGVASRSGSLRLVRTGKLLSYQIAEGNDDFRERQQTELGIGDLDTVRFAADTGGAPTLVDVRITSITLRADNFGPARAERSSAHWPYWLGALIVLLTGGGVWLWTYQRARRQLAR